MRLLLLGPFDVRDDEGRPLALAGPRLRALVSRLALEPGREVADDTLVDAVWGDAPPANSNVLQALVLRARKAIGPGRLNRGETGYRLDIDLADVDALRFERLAATGRRTGDPTALREAESLWRGPALTGLRDLRFAEAAANRLERLREETVRERLAIEVAAGVDVVAELEPLAAAHPIDERWQGLLMRALYATGRPAEALDAYGRTRERLADELGADPSAELSELHLQILRRTTGSEPRQRRRGNLSTPLTSLVGRDEDLGAVAAALAASRLVTVTGPGGAGKTRLAIEAAARAEAPDGVWMVELAAVRDPADVAPAVLRSIGAREAGLLEPSDHDAASRLEEYFADRRALLVFDNCEHLVGAVAALAVRLLGACPELRLLASSREALAVSGEHRYPIPPLDCSGPEPHASPAVRLFCERAAAVRPGFALDAGNTAAVVEICRRLDGLPLALELAAARTRALDPAQIAARLDDRFALLTAADRTAPERHRTLEAVIAWSWEQLSEPERSLAMRLSVYPAGIGPDRVADIDAVAGLVDKSLVDFTAGRYRMLETVRAYAAARLESSDRAAEERTAMAAYCLDLAERSDAALRDARQIDAMSRLDEDHVNLLEALRRSVATGDAAIAVRLTAALFWYWQLRGLQTERLRWTRSALSASGTVPAALRPARLALRGMLHAESGEFAAAQSAIDDALTAAGALPDPVAVPGRFLLVIAPAFLPDFDAPGAAPSPGTAGWEHGMALLLSADTGRTDGEAVARVERARAVFERLGERWGLAASLRVGAEHRSRRGEHDAALDELSRAALALDELGAAAEAAETYAELAVALARARRSERARSALEDAFARAEDHRDPRTTAYVRWARAEVLLHSGERRAALREVDAVEPLFTGTALEARIRVWGASFRALIALVDGDAAGAPRSLDGLTAAHLGGAPASDLAVAARLYAALALAEHRTEHAAFLLGAATALLGTSDRRGYDQELSTDDRVLAALGTEAFSEAYGRGAALERGAAVAAVTSASPRR